MGVKSTQHPVVTYVVAPTILFLTVTGVLSVWLQWEWETVSLVAGTIALVIAGTGSGIWSETEKAQQRQSAEESSRPPIPTQGLPQRLGATRKNGTPQTHSNNSRDNGEGPLKPRLKHRRTRGQPQSSTPPSGNTLRREPSSEEKRWLDLRRRLDNLIDTNDGPVEKATTPEHPLPRPTGTSGPHAPAPAPAPVRNDAGRLRQNWWEDAQPQPMDNGRGEGSKDTSNDEGVSTESSPTDEPQAKASTQRRLWGFQVPALEHFFHTTKAKGKGEGEGAQQQHQHQPNAPTVEQGTSGPQKHSPSEGKGSSDRPGVDDELLAWPTHEPQGQPAAKPNSGTAAGYLSSLYNNLYGMSGTKSVATTAHSSSINGLAPTQKRKHTLERYREKLAVCLGDGLESEAKGRLVTALAKFREALSLVVQIETVRIGTVDPDRERLKRLKSVMCAKKPLIQKKLNTLTKQRAQSRSPHTTPVRRHSQHKGIVRPSSSTTNVTPSRGSSTKRKSIHSASKDQHNGEESLQAKRKRVLAKTYPGLEKKFIEQILDEILDYDTGVTMEDIVGMEKVKASLNETLVLPAKRPELFQGLRAPSKGLLLFGPPGNGKTMIAKAVARSSGCTFFNISSSVLTSKWMGESEKLVRALFTVARELQPSIIFIDEIDSILKARSDNENESGRRLKTEMLVQIDGAGVKKEDNKVLVMGATNRPMDIDSAVIRRLPARIYVPLPDKALRAAIVSKALKNTRHVLGKREFDQIADHTEGFSCSDLTCLVRDAVMKPIRDLMPHIDAVKEEDIRGVNVADFGDSLQRIRRSVNDREVRLMEDWNKEFGFKT